MYLDHGQDKENIPALFSRDLVKRMGRFYPEVLPEMIWPERIFVDLVWHKTAPASSVNPSLTSLIIARIFNPKESHSPKDIQQIITLSSPPVESFSFYLIHMDNI